LSLAELGEGKWKETVKGDDDDFRNLTAISDARLTALLLKRLDNDNPGIRFLTAVALGRLKCAQAYESLTKILAEDKDKYVRIAAAQALFELNDPRTIDPFIQALESANVPVRDIAIIALKRFEKKYTVSSDKIKNSDSLVTFKMKLDSKYYKTRRDAARALAAIAKYHPGLDILNQELINKIQAPHIDLTTYDDWNGTRYDDTGIGIDLETFEDIK
jgi:HEAT repeat protein